MTDDLTEAIAAGLASRMRLLASSLDRLDRLESGSGSWRATFDADELPAAANEMTLRGLRVAADPTNFIILSTLVANNSQSMKDVIQETELGRLVLSERLNDLIQVGFATRMIDTDHAQITAAGAAVFHLIQVLSTQISEQFQAES